MAKIALYIDDATNRLALRAMLEADGHRIVGSEPDVTVADSPARALAQAAKCPTLLLASAALIPEAVEAMRRGVYGYIFVPLQPAEASLMVRRAFESRNSPNGKQAAETEWRTLEEVESQHILETLRRCRHNQARAARILGIGRNTLWRKLKKMGIAPESEVSPVPHRE